MVLRVFQRCSDEEEKKVGLEGGVREREQAARMMQILKFELQCWNQPEANIEQKKCTRP